MVPERPVGFITKELKRATHLAGVLLQRNSIAATKWLGAPNHRLGFTKHLLGISNRDCGRKFPCFGHARRHVTMRRKITRDSVAYARDGNGNEWRTPVSVIETHCCGAGDGLPRHTQLGLRSSSPSPASRSQKYRLLVLGTRTGFRIPSCLQHDPKKRLVSTPRGSQESRNPRRSHRGNLLKVLGVFESLGCLWG